MQRMDHRSFEEGCGKFLFMQENLKHGGNRAMHCGMPIMFDGDVLLCKECKKKHGKNND